MMWWHYACESEPRLRETAAVWYCHGFVGWFDPGISGTHVVASALDAGSSHRVSTGSKIASRLRTEGPLWVAQRMIRQILTPASAQSTVRTRELERQIVPTFDRVLANSAFTGEGVCAAFGVEAVTCHPGINVGDELGLGGTDRDGILVLARLDPSKNVIAVLSALEVLRDNGTVPFGRCTIAGSGPAEDDLRSFCAARGLDSLVDFVGAVSGAEKEQLYDCAALFVLPCLDEGFGLVFVEAADHGVPAIGPLHGGPSEIIVPGDTGWLVDELDPAALAAAILEAFSDRGRLAAFGKAARERAREVFSVEAFVRRFEAALDDAVRSKSDTRAGLIRG
jgi:glycosyltransferase involved in cell wall biosynthesis